MIDEAGAQNSADVVAASEDRRPGARDPVGRLLVPTLVGREREREVLLGVTRRPPALVLVVGEAGVGKTRLVRDTFADRAGIDRRVLIGHCHRLSEPFPLGSVVEALRGAAVTPPVAPLSPLAGVLEPLLPELAEILPAAPAPTRSPRADRHRVFRALLELIAVLGPTVLILEDLHWADEGTLEFLEFLVSQPPADLSLVLTYRAEELPATSRVLRLNTRLPVDAVTATLELSPLDVGKLRELARAILDVDDVSHELAKDLHERTAGIPFAVEELVRLLAEHGRLPSAEDAYAADELAEVGVPPAIQQSIRKQMATLSADACLVARAAAVLSLPATDNLIARVAGLPRSRADTALAKARAAAVLGDRGGRRYGYRHALAAQAVYDDIPAPERRRLHLSAAEALESTWTPPPLQLAHHCKRAGRHDESARHAEAAADAALSAGDNSSAVRLLVEALSGPRLARKARLQIALKLGPAALSSSEPEAAIPPLQRVLDEEPLPTPTRGELRYWLSRLRCEIGDAGPWREQMARAAHELEERPALAARAMVNLAWSVYSDEHFEHELGWLRRAVEAVARTDDGAAKTAVHCQRAAILLSVGEAAGWDALDDIPPEGDSPDEQLQLLRGYHSLAVAALGLGHFGPAKSFLAEVARLDDGLDHVSWGPWCKSTRIALDWHTGRWEGLEPRIHELSKPTRGRAGISVGNALVLSSLWFCQGKLDEAEQSFESVLERTRARHWMSARIAAAAGLGRIRLARGDAHAASEAAALGREIIERKGIWVWGRELAPVAVAALLECGDMTAANDLAELFAAGVKDRDAPAARAASLFCIAAVAEARGREREAANLFARAEEAWGKLPCPYEAAQAREARGRCLVANGHADEADLLLQALQSFVQLGARWDATRVRATLRAHEIPAPAPSRGGRRSYGDELSPREAEVVQFVRSAKTNREIAKMLFISPRTVEAHVASAVRKLGVESRQELATAAEINAADYASASSYFPRK